jgi:cyclopropane fatty-acyl-phospholipid synthase-like methyltransferase
MSETRLQNSHTIVEQCSPTDLTVSSIAQKPLAPATDRNRAAILAVIRVEFKHSTSVLEIGSGTGQHAVFFGQEMPWLCWQTSDRNENHEGINAWLAEASLSNVRAPLALDVEAHAALPGLYDAVFSANTAHIMSIEAVRCMFRLVADCLPSDGLFCLYGPFNLDGAYTSESNQMFDESLKSRDPRMGIRALESLDNMALANDLLQANRYAMPANNMLAVWKKS